MRSRSNFEQFRLDRAGDRADDFVLQFEQIGQVAIVALGHDVVAGVGLNKLRGDADAVAGFAHAAFDNISRA